jgi:hypothetical protein
MLRMEAARGRAGSSLVELLIALALTGTVVGSLLLLGERSVRLFEAGMTSASLEVDARRALERLARVLQGARAGSLAALPETPLWQDALDFDRVVSIDRRDGSVTWSASRVEFRHEPGETDDGADDDGDGLVDEGLLVLVQDVGGAEELTLVLARAVREHLEGELPNGLDDNENGLIDERGVVLERVGGDLRLHLTLEALDRAGRPVTRTLVTHAWPRN